MNNLKLIKTLLEQDVSNLSDKEIIKLIGIDKIDNAFETLRPIGIILALIVIAFFAISVFVSIKALSFIVNFKVAILLVISVLIVPLYHITSSMFKLIGLLLKLIF